MPAEPGDLYTLDPQAADGLGEPVLLVALDGYVDAGNAAQLATTHLRQLPAAGADPGVAAAAGEPAVTPDTADDAAVTDAAEPAGTAAEPLGDTVVAFDTDLLIDYRSRRPVLTYTDGAFTGYAQPQLRISRQTDAAGTDYLLLTGPEPDVLWERFTAAMIDIVQRLRVRTVVLLQAIPMAVPHTRPAGMSRHATRPGLVDRGDSWMGTLQIPGFAAGLLEYRLGELGLDAVGLSSHVPHYLARSDYPLAAQHLLRVAGEHTGLSLRPDGLDPAIENFNAQLASELAGNAEVTEVVRALEQQYDTFAAATGRGLLAGTTDLPTADELGAQFEAFLADQEQRPH